MFDRAFSGRQDEHLALGSGILLQMLGLLQSTRAENDYNSRGVK
jgi:hypothetical protein